MQPGIMGYFVSRHPRNITAGGDMIMNILMSV
jgi:hypothetical protein